jgi:uncharacterized membrane protein
MTIEALMSASFAVLLGILYVLTPFFSRTGIFFGITVNPVFRDSGAAHAISRRYRITVWIVTAVTCVLCIVSSRLGNAGATALLIPLQAVGLTVALLVGRSGAKSYAEQPDLVREAVLAPRRNRLPGGVLGGIGPFALLAVTAIAAHLNPDRLPDRLPVHWGLTLQPDRWIEGTPRHIDNALLGAALVCVLMLVLAYAILGSRRVNTSGPAGKREDRHRAINVWILLGAAYLIALTACVPLLAALAGGGDIAAGPAMAALAIVPLVALVAVLVRFAKQSRERAGENESSAVRGDATPDERWYGGILYFNREDPAIVVEKRFGFGYTLNMGHPVSWAITALAIALPFVVSALR